MKQRNEICYLGVNLCSAHLNYVRKAPTSATHSVKPLKMFKTTFINFGVLMFATRNGNDLLGNG